MMGFGREPATDKTRQGPDELQMVLVADTLRGGDRKRGFLNQPGWRGCFELVCAFPIELLQEIGIVAAVACDQGRPYRAQLHDVERIELPELGKIAGRRHTLQCAP